MESALHITNSLKRLFHNRPMHNRGILTRVVRVCAWSIFSFLFVFPQLSTAQCTVVCRNSLNISLDPSGQAVISPLILLLDPSCNPADFSVEITDNAGQSHGNLLSCELVGQTVTARAIQTATGNYCTTNILVQDYLAPTILCQDTIIPCTHSFDPAIIGYPDYFDNCTDSSNLQISYSDEINELACYTIFNGDSATTRVDRTWLVTDAAGNSSTCFQQIYLKRSTVDDVVFPPHMDGIVQAALSCMDDPNDLDLTGVPTINGQPIINDGYCELVVTPSDQIVDICSPGSYRILRTWTVIDYCSGDFDLGIQIIKLVDTTAPVLNMPPDLTLATRADDCTADVVLSTASASDDCSAITITYDWAFGSGIGPFYNVPAGNHPVTYTATDDCGNAAVDTLWVSILDQTLPFAVCDFDLQIGLNSSGITQVAATSFDDGSTDNCSAVSFEVSRDGIFYAPFVQFDCADLNVDSVEIWLRVTDVVGNYNECSSIVFVRDFLAPNLICPSTRYLECTENYLDLSKTGQPSVSDNCVVDTLYFADQTILNDCNIGSILRTWTAIDESGNHTTCTQTIYLEDNTPLEVYLPGDTSLLSCTTGHGPAISGNPIFVNNDCENLYINYEDALFDLGFPACYKIVRSWTVIDWCLYDPNSGSDAGYWSRDQVISIYDGEAPIITCQQADTLVSSYADNCGSTYVALTPTTAFDCNPNLTITNDSPYADTDGADASGNYPVGMHIITFTAVDGCDNQSTCSFQLTIQDAKPPTPYCLPGLSFSLPPGGILSPDPTLLDLGSTDNCTAAGDLVFSMQPGTFNCDDVGSQVVDLVVTDQAGNSSVCTSVITITDGNGVCPFSAIGGSIENEKGQPVTLVDIQLSGGVDSVQQVGVDGTYSFERMPNGIAYAVEPQKDTDYKNGISSYDLVLISQHILGINTLGSPYKMIAADVNKSGSITAFDMVEIRKLILNLSSEFNKTNSWRFVRADYNFPIPTKPFRYSFPEVYSVEALSGNVLDADFVGIKIGDVNTNHNPSKSRGVGEERNAQKEVQLMIEEQPFRSGEKVRVAVRAKEFENLLGFQFGFRYKRNLLKLLDVEFSETGKEIGLGRANLGSLDDPFGQIRFSWNRDNAIRIPEDSILFELVYEAIDDGELSTAVLLDRNVLEAEAYTAELAILPIKLTIKKIIENKLEIFQNYPNPVVNKTTIPFYIPEAGNMSFRLYNVSGKIVKEIQEYCPAANDRNELELSAAMLSPGVYFYQIQQGEKLSKSLKMIIL